MHVSFFLHGCPHWPQVFNDTGLRADNEPRGVSNAQPERAAGHHLGQSSAEMPALLRQACSVCRQALCTTFMQSILSNSTRHMVTHSTVCTRTDAILWTRLIQAGCFRSYEKRTPQETTFFSPTKTRQKHFHQKQMPMTTYLRAFQMNVNKY